MRNTNNTSSNKQAVQACSADPRTVALLDTLDLDTQRNLAVLALELLGCLANDTDKIVRYELEEEMEQAGLLSFYEENERELRRLRRTN